VGEQRCGCGTFPLAWFAICRALAGIRIVFLKRTGFYILPALFVFGFGMDPVGLMSFT
jgi:hypothetical protein